MNFNFKIMTVKKSIIIKNIDGASYSVLPKNVERYIDDNSRYFDSVNNDWDYFASGKDIRDYTKYQLKIIDISFTYHNILLVYQKFIFNI